MSSTGATRRAASSGQTCASNAAATAPLNSTVRGRSVEPVWTRRLTIILETSALGHRAALRGDLDDAPLERGGRVVAADIVAADHVEDDIGTLALGEGP